jgi:Mrp family chromosome partitioning ATPase
MMFLRRKPKAEDQPYNLPLTLQAADGQPLHTFPGEIISSMRHLENTLVYNQTLPKSLAMVAALSGEGVTYSALAFAATLASDLQTKVCVVELNWYTPGLINRLSEPTVAPSSPRSKKAAVVEMPRPTIDGGPGLAGVLMGECSLDEAIIPTQSPNLSLLPAGTLAPAIRATIARSEVLQQCLTQLGERFEHLVLDIPAINLTRDAIALASLGQGCCVVIRQRITPVSSVQQALDELTHLNMLGVILNQVSSEVPRWMYRFIPQE